MLVPSWLWWGAWWDVVPRREGESSPSPDGCLLWPPCKGSSMRDLVFEPQGCDG